MSKFYLNFTSVDDNTMPTEIYNTLIDAKMHGLATLKGNDQIKGINITDKNGNEVFSKEVDKEIPEREIEESMKINKLNEEASYSFDYYTKPVKEYIEKYAPQFGIKINRLQEDNFRGRILISFTDQNNIEYEAELYNHNDDWNPGYFVIVKGSKNDSILNNILDNINTKEIPESHRAKEVWEPIIDKFFNEFKAYSGKKASELKSEKEETEKKQKEKDTNDYYDNFTWNESLKEDLEANNIDDLPEKTQNKLEVAGYSKMITDAIVHTWEQIDNYNSIIATLRADEQDESMIKVMEDILSDLMIHIGQLEKLLKRKSPSIGD